MNRGHLFAGVILATASSPSFASDLGTAKGFNAFIFGNAVTNGGHSDGGVAVKNNWTGSGYDALQANKPGTIGGDNKLGMYVGGNVIFTNGGSVNNAGNARVKGDFFSQNPFNMNGGSLYIGGTKTGNVNGSWVQGNDTVDLNVFSSQLQYSLNQSAAVAALGGELINTSDPNNWQVNAGLQSGSQKGVSNWGGQA